MSERLSTLDLSFLYLEEPTTPMHVGGVAVLEPPASGFDHERLAALIGDRIALVPRYRQKVRSVPGSLGRPVWVDDASFDLSYHVRRAALPRPGRPDQLFELVGRLMSGPLDRSRPLWEVYLVEGLEQSRVAVVTKTHHAMVDGVAAVDLAQVILDPDPRPPATPAGALAAGVWDPEPEPNDVALVVDAVAELIRRPSEMVETARAALLDARTTATRVLGVASGIFAAARTAARPAPDSPLNAEIGVQRRFAVARTDLDDYRAVRKRDDHTVNDVVLATVAGALRQWLLTRGAPVRSTTVVRAMVPVSVRGTGPSGEGARTGNRISSYLVDLPVGEPNPTVRLAQVSYAMRAHKEAGQSVGADALVRLTGFAPSTLHALSARTASGLSRRLFNVVVTNVPGPQFPLYAGGARLLEVFPVVPLARGQAVSIGLTSYDGSVYYGLNADHEAMYDIDVLAGLIEESLAELVGTLS